MKLIDESVIDQMHEFGYAVFPNLFSGKVLQDLEAVLDEIYYATEGAETREVLFKQKVAERSESLSAFARKPEFIEISTALLGPDIDLYFNQLVYKNPEGKTPFSWHQDDAYSPVVPSPYLTCWLAVSDATIENGCLSVLPGSHRQGLVPHFDSDFGLAGHRNDDPDQGIELPVSAGTLVTMWSTTLHKSGANLSQSVRKALVLQFSPPGMRHKATGLAIRSRTPIARAGVPVSP